MRSRTRVAGLAAALVLAAGLPTVAFGASAQATSAAGSSQSVLSRQIAHWQGVKPTVVLVHGAWADSSGWTPVIERLEAAGFPVVAPPNPLRGLDSDVAYIHSVLEQIKGPIILVGHSYGGAVITNAVEGDPDVKALVYIAAFAPAQGDSLASLLATPQAQTIPALPTVPTSYPEADGTTGTELTIDPAQYPSVFLDNELPLPEEQALAAEQRPLSLDAVTETSGAPAWATIPSWYLVAAGDHAIAPALEQFMAARAHAHTVEIDGPHLIMLTDPDAVTALIEQAAWSTR